MYKINIFMLREYSTLLFNIKDVKFICLFKSMKLKLLYNLHIKALIGEVYRQTRDMIQGYRTVIIKAN